MKTNLVRLALITVCVVLIIVLFVPNGVSSAPPAVDPDAVLAAITRRADGTYMSICVAPDSSARAAYEERLAQARTLLSDEAVSAYQTPWYKVPVAADQLFVAALRDDASCPAEVVYEPYALRRSDGSNFLLWGYQWGRWTTSPMGAPLAEYPGGAGAAVVLLEDGTAVAVRYVDGLPAAYSIPSSDAGRWHPLP
ncbi:hypothetical protein GF360_03810 [candidate division WWE3 bacterium]|nr:hypothetical protein [candidate division WWE3 bacterium]